MPCLVNLSHNNFHLHYHYSTSIKNNLSFVSTPFTSTFTSRFLYQIELRSRPNIFTSLFYMSLKQHIAVITGGTRGIGRGLALGLAERGAHLIITGRTKSGERSLESTAEAVKEAGGTCETFVVDHSDDDAVCAFFLKLQNSILNNPARQHPVRLIFVNNAYNAVDLIVRNTSKSFWDRQPQDPAVYWDAINDVGLRNHFACSVRAAKLIRDIPGASGIVVNITSWAGIVSLFDVAYSVGKAAIDRMSAEFGRVAPKGISFMSLCPGFVGTEALLQAAQQEQDTANDVNGLPMWNMETPLFVGRVLASICSDDEFIRDVNGKVVIAAEAADYFGVDDENGFRALSSRSVRANLMKSVPSLIESPLRLLVPRTLVIPWWLVRAKISAIQYWN